MKTKIREKGEKSKKRDGRDLATVATPSTNFMKTQHIEQNSHPVTGAITIIPSENLVLRFGSAVRVLVNDIARELHYPRGLLRMLSRYGPVGAARVLVLRSHPSDTFCDLIVAERPDLTMEALVMQSRWQPLFTNGEQEAARLRLVSFGAGWLTLGNQ